MIREVDRAILLLAGRGHRLGSLTERRPKCLLHVNGVSILERILESLNEVGVSEAILVVGYRSEQIRHVAGAHYAGMDIRYVLNERYAQTNTAYSLWLARRHLDGECLLLEGDLLFDVEVLKQVLRCSKDKPVWAAVPVTPGRDEGVFIDRGEGGYVSRVRLVRQPQHEASGSAYKCAGIQLLTAEVARSLAAALDEVVSSGQMRIFADLVLGAVLGERSAVLCSLNGMRWGEVDTVEDLRHAEQLFCAAQGADQR